jgi:serine/threonine protein kinase
MILLDPDKDIDRQLRALPRMWRDPLSRYARKKEMPKSGVEGSWIGHRRDGSVERMRYASLRSKALLLAEYLALKKVRHEHLVQLCWAGIYARRFYVATSWVEVETRKDWPIPIRTLLAQMECAARGVAALHAEGLVHGDLKPETIIWDGESAIVTDLKLAAPAGLRKHASFSPKFAAPEQILEQFVGPQADVYALGVTLYTLFIRDRFPSLLKTPEATVKHRKSDGLSATTEFEHLKEEPAGGSEGWIAGAKMLFRSRLSSVVEGVQAANLIGSVLAIVQRACELDPEKRYPDAAALAAALSEVRARG